MNVLSLEISDDLIDSETVVPQWSAFCDLQDPQKLLTRSLENLIKIDQQIFSSWIKIDVEVQKKQFSGHLPTKLAASASCRQK